MVWGFLTACPSAEVEMTGLGQALPHVASDRGFTRKQEKADGPG